MDPPSFIRGCLFLFAPTDLRKGGLATRPTYTAALRKTHTFKGMGAQKPLQGKVTAVPRVKPKGIYSPDEEQFSESRSEEAGSLGPTSKTHETL